MGSYITAAVGLMLLMLLFAAPSSEPAPPPSYRCVRASKPVAIDGKIDDAEWSAAAWTEDFVTLRTTAAPALRTRAKMMWDERFLYIAAQMSDADVRATVREHDAMLFEEGALELFIDPDGDSRDYVEFQINPLDTTMDLLMSKPYSAGGKANLKFELAKLRHAVAIDGTINDSTDRDRGWSVELAIPIDDINKLAANNTRRRPSWRINLARAWRQSPQSKTIYATWAQTGDNLHEPQRFGTIEFSDAK